MGNDLFGAFGRDFTTKDGQTLMLLAITPKQWSKALEALGIAAEAAALEAELGVSFAKDEGLRFTHRARLYPLFERAFAAKTAAELAPAFDAGGVTWGAYQTLEAALDDPRLYKGNPVFAGRPPPQRPDLSGARRHGARSRRTSARRRPPRARGWVSTRTRCWPRCWACPAGRSPSCTTRAWSPTLFRSYPWCLRRSSSRTPRPASR